MVALKAKYNHGTIDWEEPPPFQGCCDLIVIFTTPGEADFSASRAAKRRCIDRIHEHFKGIPPGVSLVDELIAERRLEAGRE
jgi:hypothetical protein